MFSSLSLSLSPSLFLSLSSFPLSPSPSLPMKQLLQNRQKLPLSLFLALCLNLILAPAVLAAANGELLRHQAYWLALLGLATVAIAIYLFVVMFVPEKF